MYKPVRLLRYPSLVHFLWRQNPIQRCMEKYSLASAPRLWIKLPDHFKLAAGNELFGKVLKTYLFKLAHLYYLSTDSVICRMCQRYVSQNII